MFVAAQPDENYKPPLASLELVTSRNEFLSEKLLMAIFVSLTELIIISAEKKT